MQHKTFSHAYTFFFRFLPFAFLAVAACTPSNESVAPSVGTQGVAVSPPAPTTAPARMDVEESHSSELYFPQSERAGARTTAGVTDYVDFDDSWALTIIPDYAAFTFATAPFYIQQVGTAWVHVKENNDMAYNVGFRSNYGHYHLSYQNFVPCLTNGQFGKPSGNNCVAINPLHEPRTLDTHYGDEWIKIYAYDYTHPSRVFDLLRLTVTHGPIKLWFRKQDGSWWHWSSLGTGTWNFSAYCTGITEVLISGTGTASIGFDNVQVNVPY